MREELDGLNCVSKEFVAVAESTEKDFLKLGIKLSVCCFLLESIAVCNMGMQMHCFFYISFPIWRSFLASNIKLSCTVLH